MVPVYQGKVFAKVLRTSWEGGPARPQPYPSFLNISLNLGENLSFTDGDYPVNISDSPVSGDRGVIMMFLF